MSVVYNLSDLSKDQITKIVKELTFQAHDPNEENAKNWGKTPPPSIKQIIQMYSIENKQIKLPLKFAEDLFEKKHNQNDFPKFIENNIPNFILNLKEHQIEPAIELLKILKKTGYVIIGLPPGFGKTILGIWLSYILGYNLCIFCHRETIAKQWIKTIQLTIPDILSKIWFVGDSDLLEDEIPPITICLNTRYTKIPQRVAKTIGTVIVDECHLFCSPSNKDCLLFLQPKYVIMETATLERDDKMERMIYSIVGTNGVFKTLKTIYQIYKINTHIKVDESFTTRGVDAGKLYKSLAENEERNKMILNIVKNNPHRKFMILSKLADHVATLKSMFTENGLSCDTLFRSKNTYNDSNILIGTLSKISTGFDESTNCSNFQGIKSNVLILTHTIKKWQLFTQIRGRMRFDEDGLIPIFVWLSDNNQMCKRHFKDLIPCMQDTNGDITEINYIEDNIIFPTSNYDYLLK